MLKAVDVNEISLEVYHSDILFIEQQVPVTNESDNFPGLHIVAFWPKNLHQFQQTWWLKAIRRTFKAPNNRKMKQEQHSFAALKIRGDK